MIQATSFYYISTLFKPANNQWATSWKCGQKEAPAIDKHVSLPRGQINDNPVIEPNTMTVIHMIIENT